MGGQPPPPDPKVPSKLLSVYAEVVAIVLAGLGLLSDRKHLRREPLLPVAATAKKRG